MKKVLIITYYWPPSGGAGVQRWVKFVKYLVRMNYEPLVLTVHPDSATYPQTDPTLVADIPENVQVFYAKSFELYSLYKKLSSNKEVPYGGFANTNKLDFKEKVIRFIRGNFFIPDPRKGWNKYAIAKAKELIRIHQIDTVITTSPPHSTQLIGLHLQKVLNVKWVADLRDPWTDIYYFNQMYPAFIARQIQKKLEKKVLVNADRVITVSEELKKLFSGKADNISPKIKVIPNGFDTADFQGTNKTVHPDVFYISYVGTISNEYTLTGFIKALVDLPKEIRSKLRIRFIGKMPSELIERFENAKLTELIELTGYVPHHKAIEFLFSSDMLLLIIPDVKNNEGILTGKLFEYLASQKPILLIGPEKGDAAKIVRETNSGVICGYNDHQKIKEDIIRNFELKHSGKLKSASSGYMKYSRENLTKKLVEVLESL
jgi:glycosyltransferase involved in cell wall biosynthesis